jgi:hypothetical protein
MHEGHSDLDQTTTAATYSSRVFPCLRSVSLSSVSTNITFPSLVYSFDEVFDTLAALEIVSTVITMFGDREFNIHATTNELFLHPVLVLPADATDSP